MQTLFRARRRHRSRGQALVEFAFVAPVFFLLLFGIIEAGRFIFYYEVLNNATREGARYAIVNGANSITACAQGGPTGPAAPNTTSCDPNGDDVAQAVRTAAIGTLGTGVTVDRCWWYSAGTCDFVGHGPGDNGRGATVTVAAAYTYSALIPLVPLPNITVTAESSLVINN
jgi:Flp pilus assembly protein TadG